MKKIFALVLALLLGTVSVGMLSACGPKGDYIVGIVRITKHPALDLASKGFKAELTRLMAEQGKTVGYSDKHASGQTSDALTISKNYVNKQYNMLVGIATPAATQALMATGSTGIPVMFTAVTDAVDAKLVASNEKPGKNVTGTSDLNPIKEQIRLITRLFPNKDNIKIAVMYNNSETNSAAQLNRIKAMAAEFDITVAEEGILSTAEIQATVNKIGADNSIDAIYIPTDNMLADAAATVHTANLNSGKKPIICGETNMNELCGVATYGIDYEKLGAQTAKMAFEILFNNANPAEMAVQYPDKAKLSINTKIAKEIGFAIPSDVAAENGVEITPEYS